MAARIRVREGENIGSAWKRFEKDYNRSGIRRVARAHDFFMSRGEKKRLKSKAARKRARKLARKIARKWGDYRPDWEERKPWQLDAKWPIDLNVGRKTAHICIIIRAETADDNYEGLIIAKNHKDKKEDENSKFDGFDTSPEDSIPTVGKMGMKWGFVGGGVEPGESIKDAGFRESWEETGFKVRLLNKGKPILVIPVSELHNFVVFVADIIGGEFIKGEEIEAITIKSVDGLLRFVKETDGLKRNHRVAFEKYLELYHPDMLAQLRSEEQEAEKCIA